jgi:hypothetical protein
MKVVLTSPVDHDGTRYNVGQEVDVTKAQAEALVLARSAEVAAPTEERHQPTKAELLAEAKAEGLTLEGVTDKSTKAEIEAAIDAARAAKRD